MVHVFIPGVGKVRNYDKGKKRELREKPQDLRQKTSKIKNFRIQATFIEYEVD